MTIQEIKEATLALGYTRIRRDEANATLVDLKSWPGFSSHVTGGEYAQVDYYLEGNESSGHKVRVHKALDGDHWYSLS